MNDHSLAELATRFHRDGFVFVPGVFDAVEIARYGAAMDAAVASRKRHDTRTLEQKSLYEQSFIQCQYLWEDFPEIRGLTFHPRIGEIAAALTGAQRVRLWHDQALYKEAGGRETEAHQDQPYWPINERDTVTAWMPLCRVDDRTGCMGYVPSSHLGEAEFIDIFNTPGDGQRLKSRFASTPPSYIHCAPGDVIFHHGYTVHLAKPNLSDSTRRVYTAIYFRDGCTRGGTRPHPSVDRSGIAEGAIIDGGATPIAWPLQNGQSPTPEPWPQTGGERLSRARELGIIPRTE
jgi:ectoine hydroxylase-related dioxygenase (phytanoyl-CoA dioxygenase family)